MTLCELAINDFQLHKVNFGNHFTSLPGWGCQYCSFYEHEKHIHTKSQDQLFLKKEWGVYFIQFVRNTGGVFTRGEAYIMKYSTILNLNPLLCQHASKA